MGYAVGRTYLLKQSFNLPLMGTFPSHSALEYGSDHANAGYRDTASTSSGPVLLAIREYASAGRCLRLLSD